MMKKGLIAVACLLVFSVTAGAAYAKQGGNTEVEKKEESKELSGADQVKIHLDDDDSVTSDTYTVTSDTYHGHNGYRGLLNAIENVKDKPAGAVIAELLLSKYGTHLTAEQKAKLEAIVDKDAALTAVADLLDQQGSVTDAVYVEKQAVLANVKNLGSYNKLGKLLEKMGKTGVKLYVNGTEPNFEVAPFIKEGNTLVPFRAIAEALKAEVSWNGDERSVTVTRGDITVKLFIGSTTAYVNGKAVQLEVAGEIKDGSTIVPVRFISEALKAVVNWDGETSSVVIYEE